MKTQITRAVIGALFFLVLIGFLGTANAGQRCGLGSKLFGGKTGIVSQMSETATNIVASGGTSIAYGTSGCKHNGYFLMDPIGKNDKPQEQLEYANANYEELLVEMAAGSGQVLSSFAQIFGCNGSAAQAFGEMTKKNYPQIIDNEQSSPEKMLFNVRENFRSNKSLVELCSAV